MVFGRVEAIRLMIIWVSIVIVVQLLSVVAGFGPAGVVAGASILLYYTPDPGWWCGKS